MSKIRFNGKDYDVVTLDQFTMDESVVFWDYTGLSLDQVSELEGVHPGLVMAMIHVAVQRAEPDVKPAVIKALVGAMPWIDQQTVFEAITEEAEEDKQLPPPSAPDAEPNAIGASSISGEGSSPTGAHPQGHDPATGTGSRGSATGATSDLATSAA